MKVVELLDTNRILLDMSAASKEAVWGVLVEAMDAAGVISDKQQYLADIALRESHGTTGVGFGVAIPHAKSAGVSAPSLAMARLTTPLDVASLDGTQADLVFLIASPLTGGDVHLRALSKLARLLMHETFLADLRAAQTPEAVLAVIRSAEE